MGISNYDIVDGKSTPILGLIWSIILRFQVSNKDHYFLTLFQLFDLAASTLGLTIEFASGAERFLLFCHELRWARRIAIRDKTRFIGLYYLRKK